MDFDRDSEHLEDWELFDGIDELVVGIKCHGVALAIVVTNVDAVLFRV